MKLKIMVRALPRLYAALSSPKLEIRPYTGSKGLFSAVHPNERSRAFLVDVAKQLGFDIEPDSLHCTVMYSRENCPDKDVSCEDARLFRGKIKKIQHWDGHNSKGYITAAIESPELEAEHYRLKGLGCVPTYSPYEPHITLWTGAKLNADLKKRMDVVTHNLKDAPNLMFGNQFIGDQDE